MQDRNKGTMLRLVMPDTRLHPYMAMALDEAILESVAKRESPPSLMIWRVAVPSVSIGYFQSVEKEVNTRECEKRGVVIFRRMTGGGAVYKDPQGEINYSVYIPEDLHPELKDIESSYGFILRGLVKALARLGLEAERAGINDVVVNGKKISGSAQTRKNGAILQHGTLLLDVDYDTMFSLLRVPKEKTSDKKIVNPRDRVTSVYRELSRRIPNDVLILSLVLGFSEGLGLSAAERDITPVEACRARELYETKYSTREWNYWR